MGQVTTGLDKRRTNSRLIVAGRKMSTWGHFSSGCAGTKNGDLLPFEAMLRETKMAAWCRYLVGKAANPEWNYSFACDQSTQGTTKSIVQCGQIIKLLRASRGKCTYNKYVCIFNRSFIASSIYTHIFSVLFVQEIEPWSR